MTHSLSTVALVVLTTLAAVVTSTPASRAADAMPEAVPLTGGASTVAFDSADGRTRLSGYLFRPAGAGPFPAIVLMHGRAGLYSTLPGSTVSLDSLSVRHRYWARFWASQGYLALLVDSFAPRGYPAGFGRGTYGERPPEVSDQTARPLDALGAAVFLQSRSDVIADRLALFGWSNGAMAVLALVTGRAPGASTGAPSSPAGTPFRAAIAFYPGCAIPERDRLAPSIPVLLLIAGDDDEVSPQRCERWARAIEAQGPGFAWQRNDGAAHNFDGLALGTRASAADRAAAVRAEAAARAFVAQHIGPGAVR